MDDTCTRIADNRCLPTTGVLAIDQLHHLLLVLGQITRRLRAMFGRLVKVLPAERAARLLIEMALLRRTVDRSFDDPEDRILAGIADLQGFGSAARPRPFIRSSGKDVVAIWTESKCTLLNPLIDPDSVSEGCCRCALS